MNNDFTIAFTGHRPDTLGGYAGFNPIRDRLMTKLEALLLQMLSQHPQLTAISGMALGFDQWATQVCIRIGIPFTAAVPYDGQEKRWPNTSQTLYHTILARAAYVHVVSPGPYLAWKLQRRNEWMINNCTHLIAAWNGSPGGTANCIEYARSRKPWDNLLPLEVAT